MTRLGAPPLQDSAAFSQIFEHYHLSVFRFIYGISGASLREVEDLTAETFIRAWKARSNFYGDEQAAHGWLITIARHLVIDAVRRKKVRKDEQLVADIDEWQPLTPHSSSENPETRVIIREQHSILVNLLTTLPVEQREMIVLRYILGWQVKQIASHLGITENTTSVYIRRTLEKLRHNWPDGK